MVGVVVGVVVVVIGAVGVVMVVVIVELLLSVKFTRSGKLLVVGKLVD